MSLETLLKRAPLVVFDTETTGLDPDKCQIIELAALKIEAIDGIPTIVDKMDEFVKLPDAERLPEKIVDLTGITDKLLEIEGKPAETVARDFVENFLAAPAILAAHNAQFDASFLRQFLKGQTIPPIKWLDTLTVCRDRSSFPHKLEAMIERYKLKGVQNSHRAIDDALALYKLIIALDAERDDLGRYLDLFGINPKYGRNGPEIRDVKYVPQICYRKEPAPKGYRLYEIARRGFND